jgi:hypothetical protein
VLGAIVDACVVVVKLIGGVLEFVDIIVIIFVIDIGANDPLEFVAVAIVVLTIVADSDVWTKFAIEVVGSADANDAVEFVAVAIAVLTIDADCDVWIMLVIEVVSDVDSDDPVEFVAVAIVVLTMDVACDVWIKFWEVIDPDVELVVWPCEAGCGTHVLIFWLHRE